MMAERGQGWMGMTGTDGRVRGWWLTAGVLAALYLVLAGVGVLSLPPMVGDEVTHFHMLRHQAESLPTPVFRAMIPAPWSSEGVEVRCYPHAALWHYALAIPYRLSGGSSVVVQLIHVLFLLQLVGGILYAFGGQQGDERRLTAWVAVALVLSQPMSLLFGVTFYQDVPATAQMVWALACLIRGKWLLAAMFLSLSLNVKENMVLMLPAYGLSLLWVQWERRWRRMILAVAVTAALVVGSCGVTAVALRRAGCSYFPADNLKVLSARIMGHRRLPRRAPSVGETSSAQPTAGARTRGPRKRPRKMLYAANVIANHPGDLRRPINWLLYGGGLLPLALPVALGAALWQCTRLRGQPRSTTALLRAAPVYLCTGGVYMVLTYGMLRTSPDARFFYPGVVLCLLPVAAWLTRVPWRRVWFPLLCAAAVAQSALVLVKVHALRHVPDGIVRTVDYLRENPPRGDRVFMYPEGNYQLFTVKHEWYLRNQLLAFWDADNDRRLEILHLHRIGAIVIKKHLIANGSCTEERLGTYPRSFVEDIRRDPRFVKVFETDMTEVYSVPPEDPAQKR